MEKKKCSNTTAYQVKYYLIYMQQFIASYFTEISLSDNWMYKWNKNEDDEVNVF